MQTIVFMCNNRVSTAFLSLGGGSGVLSFFFFFLSAAGGFFFFVGGCFFFFLAMSVDVSSLFCFVFDFFVVDGGKGGGSYSSQ